MKICLDYDGTYTKDPALWDAFIRAAKDAGHEVFCITMRREAEGCGIPIPVIYTSRKAKARYAAEHDIKVDIWIDDSPHWLFQDG